MILKGEFELFEALTGNLHNILHTGVNLTSVLIELWGLFIIIMAILKEIYRVIFDFKLDFKKINYDNNLNSGLASGLEVLLASEILKTITINSYRNLIIIGILIFLRIAMTLLLVWESDHKAKDHVNP